MDPTIVELNVAEVRARLGVSRQRVDQLRRRGELDARELAPGEAGDRREKYLYTASSVDAYRQRARPGRPRKEAPA